MPTKFKKFFALNWQHKTTLLHAWFLLGLMRAGVLILSFKRLSKTLQQQTEHLPAPSLSSAQWEDASRIGWAVRTAARFTPWNSNCMAQALCAQRLLRKLQIPGLFFLGVKKDQRQLAAHAWLQCDQQILVGEHGHQDYTVVSTFSWPA